MTDPILPEYLVVADVPDEPLASHAIVPEDLDALRSRMTRGANLTMPGAVGSRPYAPILDELDVTIRWFLNGLKQPDGTPHENTRRGLTENHDFYRALIFEDADPDTGEKDFELHLDDDLVLVAPIQVWTWDVVRTARSEMTVLTRLIVATGQLAESGS